MKSHPPEDPETLEDAVNTLRVFTGIALYCFAGDNRTQRDEIAGNFVARGMTCLESILQVWKRSSKQDAWILHRSLLDRLFHLRALADEDDFGDFEVYSFKAKYEARHQLLSDSDPIMRAKIPSRLRELQRTNRDRYQEIIESDFEWYRPRAKDIAKKMDLHFLYSLGYDYASTHVHPMADDGKADFQRLISPTQSAPLPDATVVRNSILAQVVLTKEAFTISGLKWRRVVFDFLDGMQSFLHESTMEFKVAFFRIAQAGPDFKLCAPSESES